MIRKIRTLDEVEKCVAIIKERNSHGNKRLGINECVRETNFEKLNVGKV